MPAASSRLARPNQIHPDGAPDSTQSCWRRRGFNGAKD
jgi:hypothetical protein